MISTLYRILVCLIFYINNNFSFNLICLLNFFLLFIGVIEFLTSGRVASDHRDFKDLAYKSCLQKISGCEKPNEFTHSFKLASAYSEDIMPYTNYT